jgi:farnesyl diphosphate synthase
MSVPDFKAWARAGQERIEQVLAELLEKSDVLPQRLHDAMRYAVLGGGKRVRSLLAFAGGELSGADTARAAIAGAAVEMIHAYSLVHDDLPCMDDDVLRRGKPTCHVQYDEPTALLVGDALQSMAFEVLAKNTLCDAPAQQLEIVAILARASGSRGMAGGQAIDLESVGKVLGVPQLEVMHVHKTGAIIRAATLMGMLCGGPVSRMDYERVDTFARVIGLAFQVIDDVLDVEASSEDLGKTAGKDAEHGKPTYVSAMGLAQAKAYAEHLRNEAMTHLQPFGERALRLRQLADFIVLRKS